MLDLSKIKDTLTRKKTVEIVNEQGISSWVSWTITTEGYAGADIAELSTYLDSIEVIEAGKAIPDYLNAVVRLSKLNEFFKKLQQDPVIGHNVQKKIQEFRASQSKSNPS